MPEQILPFLAVVAVLTVTPGPDMALGLRNGLRGGVEAAWWTGLGCCLGLAVYAAVSALGLAAILAASAVAFTLIKYAGAAYLVYLGVKALLHAGRNEPTDAVTLHGGPNAMARGVAFRQGLVSNLLNPKIALIFLTLLPQFVASGEPPLRTTATLAAAFMVLAVGWWRVYSLAIGVLGRALTSGRIRTAIERVTGVVMIALGLRVALSHR